MKTFIITCITVIISLSVLPSQTDASPIKKKLAKNVYISGQTSCGCHIHKKKVVVGLDRHHKPIYNYLDLPVVHTCKIYKKPVYKASYSKSYYKPAHYKPARYNNARTTRKSSSVRHRSASRSTSRSTSRSSRR